MTKEYLKAKSNALQIEKSISNIIWLDGFDKFQDFISMVSESIHISSIELSLYNIFLTPDISQKDLFNLRNNIFEANITLSGIHNIFADTENFKDSLFSSNEMFEKTIKRVENYIDYARVLDITELSLDYMNFLKLDGLPKEEADKTFFKFLDHINRYSDGDIDIHISPTSENNRDYLTRYVDAIEMIKKGRFENIKVLVDLKEMFDTLSFDLKYFKDNHQYLTHFHVSNLDGGPITFTDIPMHNKIVNLSFVKDYTNKFFVMKIKNLTDEQKEDISNYTQFIHVFKEIYQVPLQLSPFCSQLFPNLIYRHISAEGPDVEHLFKYDIH